MPSSTSARRRALQIRLRRIRLAGLLVVIAAIGGGLGYESLTTSSSTTVWPSTASSSSTASASAKAAPTIAAPRSARRGAPGEADGVVPRDATLGGHGRALGEGDGAVPSGTSVFDEGIPGVVNLDPDLLGALRHAATDAAADGVEVVVDSGWRTPEYQEQLLREAVAKYGSVEEAARWVASPKSSAHVSGDAVDIGPDEAAAWLSEHGARYGLCRIYGNEPWHFELRPEAVSRGCPPTYADATHDPRLQQ